MTESTKTEVCVLVENALKEIESNFALMRNLVLQQTKDVSEKRKRYTEQFLGDYGDENYINDVLKTNFLNDLSLFLQKYTTKKVLEDKKLHEALWCLGFDGVRSIENALDDMKKSELNDALSEYILTFSDITRLGDRDVQKILREVDINDLAKALKGSSDAVKEKIYRNMSRRTAQMLKDDIEYMGPVSKKEIAAVQSNICVIMKRLDESGEILIHTDFIEEE